MSRRGGLPLLVCLLGLAARPAPAQVVPSVDVGVLSLGYTGTARSLALSISPALYIDMPRSLVRASASFAQFDGGEWSAQSTVAASVFTSSWRAMRGEVAAAASGIAYRRAFQAGDGLLRARVHAHRMTSGAWAGAGGGYARHADGWHPLTLLEAGLWVEERALRVTASVTTRSVAVADSFIDNEGPIARFRRRGTHLDALLGVGWTHGALELEAQVGTREGGRLAADAQWAAASATVRVTPWMQAIVEVGGEPEVVSQRLPEGRYGLLALRFSSSPVVAPSLSRPPPGAEFIIGGEPGGMRRVRIELPDARRVELTADFTDWQPVPLSRAADGSWQLALPLAPGVYRVMIRVDGGEWRAPPDVPAVQDEFGGTVGLLVVR